jgi:hypothetical protein
VEYRENRRKFKVSFETTWKCPNYRQMKSVAEVSTMSRREEELTEKSYID